MSPWMWLGVAGLGGIGAVARFAVSVGIDRARAGRVPLGTLLVNTVGSLSAGLAFGLMAPGDVRTLAMVGLLGSLTTFSAWAVETHGLAATGHQRRAVLNVAIGATLGLAAAEIGRLIAG